MNWLHYLLEANIYLAVFYAVYCLFLNQETHYTLNRVYLLFGCIMSFILPVAQIGALKPANPVAANVVIYTIQSQAANVDKAPVEFTMTDGLWAVYIAGIAVMTLLLVIKLFKVVNLTTSGKRVFEKKYRLVDLEDTDKAFSFFNYLFIGTKISGSDIIIRHELVHIRQKHSFDIVFIELIKIINWFNPIIYLLQMSIKALHEYIADEQTAAQETDALSYSSFLVDNAYGINGSSITHSFFNYNLLKKRIIMLNQKRSGKLARLKYLMAVPICAGMLCASTLAFSKNYAFIDLAPKTAKSTLAVAKPTTADTSTRRMRTKATTSKGFSYDETGYLINSKTDFRVIITEKNGDQKSFFKSKASATELAMLKEKYGYSFPNMMIFPKLPPPPPMAPAAGADVNKMPPPPPPAPPKHGAKSMRMQPPPPPKPPVAGVDAGELPPPPPPAPPKHGAKNLRMPPPPPPKPPVAGADVGELPAPPPPAPIDAKNVIKAHVKPNTAVAPTKAKPVKAVAPADVNIVLDEVPEPAVAPANVTPATKATPAGLVPKGSALVLYGSHGKTTGNLTIIEADSLSYMVKTNNPVQPLFVVNGQQLNKSLKKGQRLNIAADKVIFYDGYSAKNTAKWGDKAKNGMIEISGNNSITVN